uniref:Uncharacterized protein n=1 Tax=Candidatus Kentrum eta TaxID=2126337 RepID=A0A450VJ01_9GAMM|nr:MAG: hypothetical protein BECKH772B_GA0070898_104832 [Candidatus Kentron sp. H]VFK04966.1 MAG: hypothetical protein BECKH772A_GA0070896_104852 [Candidatus Kentron sp. H]VFK06871.1 MAG: hypothetical protein BECKH772C_GA0070978_103812 [Candidatus Kentron sp. H]
MNESAMKTSANDDRTTGAKPDRAWIERQKMELQAMRNEHEKRLDRFQTAIEGGDETDQRGTRDVERGGRGTECRISPRA